MTAADDQTQDAIVDFALTATGEVPDPRVLHMAASRFLDTLGALTAGFGSEAGASARRFAQGQPAGACSVIGTGARADASAAAFANATAARYPELSDVLSLPGRRSGGHPSDVIMPLLALSEETASGGVAFLSAVALAYEIYYRLAKNVALDEYGLDHTNLASLAGAVAGGCLVALKPEQLAQCVAIAAVSSTVSRRSRDNPASSWKASASGAAARVAVFAVQAAAAGIEGPPAPFSGAWGWPGRERERERAAPVTFEGEPGWDGLSHVAVKNRPACMAAIPAAIATERAIAGIGSGGVPVLSIRRVTVRVFDLAWERCGRPEAARHPRTAEEADHSIPYVVASTLCDGRLKVNSYAPHRLNDAQLRDLMTRIMVVPDPDLSERHRALSGSRPAHVQVELESGSVAVGEVDRVPGDLATPLTDGELEEKFRDNAEPVLATPAQDEVIASVWALKAGAGPRLLTESFERVRRSE
ncbi:MAG TPA: MmgE/PrpD family protein [Streptosporangiaceae bacterium]